MSIWMLKYFTQKHILNLTMALQEGPSVIGLQLMEIWGAPNKAIQRIPPPCLCRRVCKGLRNLVFLPWWERYWVRVRGRTVWTDDRVCILSEACWRRCVLVWVHMSSSMSSVLCVCELCVDDGKMHSACVLGDTEIIYEHQWQGFKPVIFDLMSVSKKILVCILCVCVYVCLCVW